MENQVFASASDYIDLNRYPLDRPDSDQYAKIVSDAASQLSDDGCCVLKGFIRQKALPDLVRQAELVAPHATDPLTGRTPTSPKTTPIFRVRTRDVASMTARTPSFRPTISAPRRVFVPSMNMTRSSFS